MEKQKTKNKSGITLVALIITVIVMMILIGVTISLITSNDLTRVAENAVGQYENQMRLEGSFGEVVTIDGKEYSSLEAYLQKLSGEIPWIYEENEDGTITITGIDFTLFNTSSDELCYATTDLGIETLVFPSKLDGKTVIGVDWKDLVIPVDTIVAGNYADITLPGIKKVIFSDTILYLDAGYNSGADDYSYKLILPDAEEVVLPSGLEEIGDRFFAGWGWDEENLQSNLELELPASVRTIEGYAFNLIKKVYLRPGKFTENDVDTAGRWGANEVIIDYAFEIGDYVNYNPTVSDLQGTALANENIYYKSMEIRNGFADQEFQATADVKWRICSYNLNSGTVTLISENGVNSKTGEPLTLMGVVANNELDTICSIYGHGYGAINAESIGFWSDSNFEILFSTGGPDGYAGAYTSIGMELLRPTNSPNYWVDGKFDYEAPSIYNPDSMEGYYKIITNGAASFEYLDYAILVSGSAFHGGTYSPSSAAIRPIVTISLDKLDTDNSIVANGITTFNLK